MSEVRGERRYCETPTVVPLHDAQSDEVRATDESPNVFYLYELSLRWISQPSPSYKQAETLISTAKTCQMSRQYLLKD